MTALRDLLADVAEQAKTYDVTDRAVRAARRRARLRRYTPVAALVVVALVVAAVWVPLGRSRDGEPAVTGPVGLPAVVVPPAQPPPALDPDRPVGRGSLLYRVRERPGMVLVAENGRQYTVPDPAALGLSPDGRWLLLNLDHRLVVQDLRDGGRRQLSATDPDRLRWRWSPDGRWLALAPALGEAMAPAGDRVVTLMDLANGWSAWSRTLPPSTAVLAVLDSGEILTQYVDVDGTATGERSLTVLGTSAPPRSLPLGAAGVLRPGEQLNSGPLLTEVLPDGSTALIRTSVEQTAGDVTAGSSDDVLVLDTARGTVLRRIELPDPVFRVPEGEHPSGGNHDVRLLAVTAPEGILLWHHKLDGRVELELMDRETGHLTVVTRPADDRIEDLRPRGFAY